MRNFLKVLAYSPSQGEDYLTEAFENYYKANNIDIGAEDIVVTTGGSEEFSLLFFHCDIGDEVIVLNHFTPIITALHLKQALHSKLLQPTLKTFQLPRQTK